MKKHNKLKITLVVIILTIIIGLFITSLFKKSVNKKVINYAEIETKHFITNLIQSIVDNVSDNELNDNKIFNITRNDYNEIEIIDFNTKEVNDVLENITKTIEKKLNLLENGESSRLEISPSFKGKNFVKLKKGVLFELGDDFYSGKFSFLNKNTKVPLRLSFVGNVYANIVTNIKNYGLNSAYMEVKVNVEIKYKIFLPTSSKQIVIKEDFPIAIKIIQGSIPNYYNGQFQSNSTTYSLPLKK